MANAVTEQTFAEDLADLMEKIENDGLFGNQVAVNDTGLLEKNGIFEVTISPSGGNYSEGEFIFQIVIDNNRPPKIYSRTAMYHPNLDKPGVNDEVFINLPSECSLQKLVKNLLDLMYHPTFPKEMQTAQDMEEYWQNVDISIAGGEVDGYLYTVNPKYARNHCENNEEDD